MKIVRLINSLSITLILSIISITVFAEGAKVTPLMQKTLNALTNKEAIMIDVEYAPGMPSNKHRHDADVLSM